MNLKKIIIFGIIIFSSKAFAGIVDDYKAERKTYEDLKVKAVKVQLQTRDLVSKIDKLIAKEKLQSKIAEYKSYKERLQKEYDNAKKREREVFDTLKEIDSTIKVMEKLSYIEKI